jgi:hypothetical protein
MGMFDDRPFGSREGTVGEGEHSAVLLLDMLVEVRQQRDEVRDGRQVTERRQPRVQVDVLGSEFLGEPSSPSRSC